MTDTYIVRCKILFPKKKKDLGHTVARNGINTISCFLWYSQNNWTLISDNIVLLLTFDFITKHTRSFICLPSWEKSPHRVINKTKQFLFLYPCIIKSQIKMITTSMQSAKRLTLLFDDWFVLWLSTYNAIIDKRLVGFFFCMVSFI